jgi:hypothetical protein
VLSLEYEKLVKKKLPPIEGISKLRSDFSDSIEERVHAWNSVIPDFFELLTLNIL